MVCSTPHALSPDVLSPDVLSPRALSPRALSPRALSPNGLRNTCKNQALQVDFFRESIQSSISNIIYQVNQTFFITFYFKAHFHLAKSTRAIIVHAWVKSEGCLYLRYAESDISFLPET